MCILFICKYLNWPIQNNHGPVVKIEFVKFVNNKASSWKTYVFTVQIFKLVHLNQLLVHSELAWLNDTYNGSFGIYPYSRKIQSNQHRTRSVNHHVDEYTEGHIRAPMDLLRVQWWWWSVSYLSNLKTILGPFWNSRLPKCAAVLKLKAWMTWINLI